MRLNETAVTDAGLVLLEAMTDLRILELHHTQVSDAGLDHLKSLSNMRSIDLWATKVTDFGAQELRRSLPKARIVFTSLTLN